MFLLLSRKLSVTSKTRQIESNKTPKRESNLCSGCLQSAEQHSSLSLLSLYSAHASARVSPPTQYPRRAHTHRKWLQQEGIFHEYLYSQMREGDPGAATFLQSARCVFCEFVIFLITSRARNFKFHTQFNAHWNLLTQWAFRLLNCTGVPSAYCVKRVDGWG